MYMTFIASVLDRLIKISGFVVFTLGILLYIFRLEIFHDIYIYGMGIVFIIYVIDIKFFLWNYFFTKYANIDLYHTLAEKRGEEAIKNVEKGVELMQKGNYYIDSVFMYLFGNIIVGFMLGGIQLAGVNSALLIVFILHKVTMKSFAEILHYKLQNK